MKAKNKDQKKKDKILQKKEAKKREQEEKETEKAKFAKDLQKLEHHQQKLIKQDNDSMIKQLHEVLEKTKIEELPEKAKEVIAEGAIQEGDELIDSFISNPIPLTEAESYFAKKTPVPVTSEYPEEI